MTPIERAVEIAGGQTALARSIKVGQARVWNWLNRDKVLPAEYAIPIERATEGRVTRYELRPDIYPQDECPCPPRNKRRAA